MIHIITGGRDTGKTARMRELHSALGGDGIISEKIFDAGEHTGYRALRLSGGRGRLLAGRKNTPRGLEIPRGGPVLGPWIFSAEGFLFSAGEFEEILEAGEGPLFLDEIGRLELSGEGFAPLLGRLLRSGRELYFSCRDSFAGEVAEKFNIVNFSFIEVPAPL